MDSRSSLAYQKTIEEKLREVKELSDSTVTFDEEAKKLHKQLIFYRDNTDR